MGRSTGQGHREPSLLRYRGRRNMAQALHHFEFTQRVGRFQTMLHVSGKDDTAAILLYLRTTKRKCDEIKAYRWVRPCSSPRGRGQKPTSKRSGNAETNGSTQVAIPPRPHYTVRPSAAACKARALEQDPATYVMPREASQATATTTTTARERTGTVPKPTRNEAPAVAAHSENDTAAV